MTDNPVVQGDGPSAAVPAFEAFLARDEVADKPTPQKPEKAAKDAPAEDDDAEVLEADAELDETPPDDEDVEADSDDEGADEVEAAADDEDDEAEEQQQRTDTVTVKVDGKDVELPLDEVIAGYQRNADYTRKTQEISARRRELEAEANEVAVERQQYAELLSALNDQLQQMQSQEPDWQRLYEEDPLEYVRQRDIWNDMKEKRQVAQAELQRNQALQKQYEAKRLQAQIEASREQLLEAIPEWKNKQKWDADRVKLREYGLQAGYTEDELNAAYDHRAIVLLNKARKYDAMMAKRPKPKPKVASETSPRTLSAGAGKQPTRQTSQMTRAKQRLAKTGSVKDAASIFESLI